MPPATWSVRVRLRAGRRRHIPAVSAGAVLLMRATIAVRVDRCSTHLFIIINVKDRRTPTCPSVLHCYATTRLRFPFFFFLIIHSRGL